LEVNTVTGQVTFKNGMATQLPAIDFYTITSPTNALNPTGWNSMDDQEGVDPPGAGWGEATPSTGELAEFYLAEGGFTGIAAGGSVSLGNAWSVGAAQDLVFQYGVYNGNPVFGKVEYVVPPNVPGDYNGDGTVNAADYTVWRNNLGDADENDINNAGDGGDVSASDYTFWKARYGNTSGSGAFVGDGSVPEPTALFSFALGGVMLAVGVSRCRG
jgi:hypothetical protein